MAHQRYRVIVVELDHVKPRNESGLENRNLWPELHPWLAKGPGTKRRALDPYL